MLDFPMAMGTLPECRFDYQLWIALSSWVYSMQDTKKHDGKGKTWCVSRHMNSYVGVAYTA